MLEQVSREDNPRRLFPVAFHAQPCSFSPGRCQNKLLLRYTEISPYCKFVHFCDTCAVYTSPISFPGVPGGFSSSLQQLDCVMTESSLQSFTFSGDFRQTEMLETISLHTSTFLLHVCDSGDRVQMMFQTHKDRGSIGGWGITITCPLLIPPPISKFSISWVFCSLCFTPAFSIIFVPHRNNLCLLFRQRCF